MREKIFNIIGLGLLALCFAVSLTRIAMMHFSGKSKDGADVVTIRFSHWQLENGPREALDKIAAEYTKLHPNVKVQQIPIPERIYTNWLITQLVGGTAPDLIQLGKGTTEERLARFFTPLSSLATQPNPYNAGTDLEGVPLRGTLFDGMEGGYYATMLEYFGVPISGNSVRIFYNLDLMKKVSGQERIPANFEELISVCEQVRAYAARENLPLLPIAGSKDNVPYLMQVLFASQTQTLTEELRPVGIMETDPAGIRLAGDFLKGRWSLDSKSVRAGFSLMHDVGREMQPGFMQLLRDDATLTFVQGRSLAMCSGSWDATSIRQQADFRIGVGQIPIPSRDNPIYGKNILGKASEAGKQGGVSFGITRESPAPAVARDFLLFMASRKMNQVWADESGWIPSVLGTRPSNEVAPFLPVTEGFLQGFLTSIDPGVFPDVARLCDTNWHLLFGSSSSTERFLEAIKPDYRAALISDLRRWLRGQRDIQRRGDTQFAAVAWLAAKQPESAEKKDRFDLLQQAQAANDRLYFQTRLVLEQAGQPLE